MAKPSSILMHAHTPNTTRVNYVLITRSHCVAVEQPESASLEWAPQKLTSHAKGLEQWAPKPLIPDQKPLENPPAGH